MNSKNLKLFVIKTYEEVMILIAFFIYKYTYFLYSR